MPSLEIIAAGTDKEPEYIILRTYTLTTGKAWSTLFTVPHGSEKIKIAYYRSVFTPKKAAVAVWQRNLKPYLADLSKRKISVLIALDGTIRSVTKLF